MLESIQGNTFEYERLPKEEQERRGILGRLKGVIADFKNPTRNGRLYGPKLWEKLFEDPITKEKIENRCMFGEIEHPQGERMAIDPEKIAVCLAEVPKKDSKGHLIGVFDILNTPCGKILKTLLDYGTTVGVSSRGQGDTFTNYDGVEEVDPDSYECTGWDVVLLPAVKAARMQVVAESLGQKTLTQALTESINSSSDDAQKIMKETLDELGINLNSEEVNDIQTLPENDTADNDGESLVEQLSTSMLENQKLQEKVSNLQEKLSVCYAKEYDYEDEIKKYKKTISKLTESVKSIDPLKQRISSLQESVSNKQSKIVDSENELNTSKDKIKKLGNKVSNLRESLKEKDSIIESLNDKTIKIQNSYEKEIGKLNNTISDLQSLVENLKEQLISADKNSKIRQKQYSDKLEKQNKLVENYKNVAKVAVDKYIQSQANKLGVSPNEIKSKLNESYTFDDIDKACDDIQDFNLGINSLPFGSPFQQKPKIKFNESINTKIPTNEDDAIDNSLMELANQL